MVTTICKINELQEGVEIKLRVNGKIEYKIFPFRNYFYIREDDFEDVAHIIDKKAFKYELVEDRNGHEYVKIFLKNNYHRGYLRKELEEESVITYEADINAPKRLLLDNQNLPLNQDGLKIAFYDIETMDVLPFQKDFDGNIVPVHPILSIAVKEKGKDFVWFDYNRAIDNPVLKPYIDLRKEYLENPTIDNHKKLEEWNPTLMPLLEAGEKELLEKFLAYVVKFDIMSAYNGRGFDDIYIRYRAKIYGIDSDKTTNNNNFDYMECYKKNKYDPVKSFALNNVAYEELKSELDNPESNLSHPDEIRKIDWREKTNATRFFDMYVCYPELLKEYNIQDCLLLEMLESKLHLFKLHAVQAELSHSLFSDTLYNSRICDIQKLGEYKKRNYIMLSKPNDDEMKSRENDRIGGGYTYCFEPALHWGVMCFDFASHYTQVMRTWNISSETYLRTQYADLNKVFSKEEITYIYYCINIAEDYKDTKGKLNSKKYDVDIEKKRCEMESALNFDTGRDDRGDIRFLNMEELMWKFIKNYDQKIEHKEDECYTPSDFNRNTNGWKIHPHCVYSTKERSVLASILDVLSIKRDEVKYSMNQYKKGSFEWSEKDIYQKGLKTLSNSFYGITIMKGSRDYRLEVGDSITTSARYLTKIAMLETRNNNITISHGDTDSCYLVGVTDKEELNNKFKILFDEKLKIFNTMNNQKGEKHTVNFEYEKTYPAMIPIKKKRYYYYADGEVDSVGAVQTRSDVLQVAKDFQKELLYDIFQKKFDKDVWKKKIEDIRDKTFNFELDEKEITRIQGLSKPVGEYGKPVINSSTGEQKVRKSDGQPMFAPIPANVQIAKKLMAQGVNVNVSDKINFIVAESKPKIKPITIEEYRENKTYCANYYYTKIITPILEILMVVYPDLVYNHFSSCWNMTKRQLENARNKMQEEDSDEE